MVSQVFISNGNSKVFLKENKAFQRFKYFSSYEKVKNIALLLKDNYNTTIILDRISYTFNGSNFHSSFLGCNDNTLEIIWDPIVCLNQVENYREIYEKNKEKFFWDIIRAIAYINICGYEHGDVSIDNIGIKDGNFVLFDYDMSKKSSDLFSKDLYKLFKSVKFHMGIVDINFKGMLDYIFLIKKTHKFNNIQDTIIYLDNLKIYL